MTTSVTTERDFVEFAVYRAALFTAIRKACQDGDGHCKSYEGALTLTMPNVFDYEDGTGDGWALHLDCYVLGPTRHYEWTAPTLRELTSLAQADLIRWVQEQAAP